MFTTISRMALGLTAAASLVAATPAATQSGHEASAPARDHAFILAIVDSVPRPHAIAAIVRYPDSTQTDIVLVTAAAANPATLAAILGDLEASRTLDPPITETNYVFITEAKPMGVLPASKEATLTEALAQVRRQPLSQIGNLGLGHWKKFADTWTRADHRG